MANILFAASEAVPVLLRVAVAKQQDNRGYNFVQQFNELVYNEIKNGNAKLWDSPEKDILITGTSLKEIERSSATTFTQQPYIFIYESWTKTKSEIQSNTIGFTFLNKNNLGEDVSYGYVEFKDLSAALLRNTIIVNADGNYNLNFAFVLNAKQFEYNIVQFAGTPVRSDFESEKLKKDFVGSLGFNSLLFPNPTPQKLVYYVIEHPVQTETIETRNAENLLNYFQSYLRNRKDKYLEWGGDKLSAVVIADSLSVTKIEVTELWTIQNGRIITRPQQVVVYVNDYALKSLASSDLMLPNFRYNGKDLFSTFDEKNFFYIITQINSQKVERINTFKFQKALKDFQWENMNEQIGE